MNRNSENVDNLLMKAVVIYNCAQFAAKVGSLLRLVGERASVRAEWAFRCWPVEALNDIDFAKRALFDSRDAHVVVLPARYAQAVPTRLFDWLKEWAGQREICDAALGFTAESDSANPPQPICSELSHFIRQQGLHLIIGQGLTAKDAVKISVEFSSEREKVVSLKRAGMEMPAIRQSYRWMGIND